MTGGTAAAAKSLRGVTRVAPAAAPTARPSTGLVTAAVSSAVGGVVAVATLRLENPCEGELTVMTAAEGMCPMIVGRRTFFFSRGPMHGIAKLVWAGVSVLGVMSSSGEVLCVPSGLREIADNSSDSHSDDDDSSLGREEMDAKSFLHAEAHAVDICAMTVGSCPFVVTAGHQKTRGYGFPLRCAGGETKHELHELTVGPFHAVSGVSDCSMGPALLLGCTLGSVVVFEWISPSASPVVIRSILMGPSVRYIGISVGFSFDKETERRITFCAFGQTTAGEEEEEKFVTLRRVGGTPFEVKEACDLSATPLLSWNVACRDAPGRLCVEGSSLVVTQPLLDHSTSVVYHALVITVTQRGACTGKDSGQSLCEDDTAMSPSSVGVRVMDATSPGCRRALAMLRSAVAVLPTLRYTKNHCGRQIKELCLCDGRRAIFFDITDKLQLEPSGVMSLGCDDEYLVGMTWLPQTRGLLVLSGTVLDVVEGSNEHKDTVGLQPSVVGHLTLSSRELLLWEEKEETTPLTLAQVRDVVQSIVQVESEKIVACLEKRLSALERAMSTLLCEKATGVGNEKRGHSTGTCTAEKEL